MYRNSNKWKRVVELLTRISNTWGNVVGGMQWHESMQWGLLINTSGKQATPDSEFQGRKVFHRLERTTTRIAISQVVETCPKSFSFHDHLHYNVLQRTWVLRRFCQAPWSSVWQLPTCRRNFVDRNLTLAQIVGSLTFQVRLSHGHGNNTLPTLESSLSLFPLCKCQRI